MVEKIRKSDQEWEEQLTPEQYYVCRNKGTEAPFSGRYTDVFAEGDYKCVCCENPLFTSEAKFQSSCGWPSFNAPVSQEAVIYEVDVTLGMKRTEVMCARCDAHLGHVFDDGPAPTGIRFCINSVCLVHDNQ